MNAFLKTALLTALLFFSALGFSLPAGVESRSYVLLEAFDGDMLLGKNQNEALPPASLTKLMTAYLVFAALQAEQVHLYDKVNISKEAFSMPGSRMFLEQGSRVSVEDLLKGLIVQSGNDAATALAEYVGGSVETFVGMMNAQAVSMGMNHSHFTNPTGLPDPAHYSTAADIALLARRLIIDFPEYYPMYAIKEFSYNAIRQSNRNRLLWDDDLQVDGLKTGHTDLAGYCLVSSAVRGDFRVIAVVLGAESEKMRFDLSRALIKEGFESFQPLTLYRAGQEVTRLRVYGGAAEEVSVVSAEDVRVTVARARQAELRAEIQAQAPFAPLQQGEDLGRIRIFLGDAPLKEVAALSGEVIEKGNVFKVLWDRLRLKRSQNAKQ